MSESTSLSGKRGEAFDLWTGHAMYNEELKRVLKGENPKVITILRDPVDRFISAWFYFDRGDMSSLIRFVDRAYVLRARSARFLIMSLSRNNSEHAFVSLKRNKSTRIFKHQHSNTNARTQVLLGGDRFW